MLDATFYLSGTSQPIKLYEAERHHLSHQGFYTHVTTDSLCFTVARASVRVTLSPEMFNHDTIALIDLGGTPLNIAVDMGAHVVGLALSGEIQ